MVVAKKRSGMISPRLISFMCFLESVISFTYLPFPHWVKISNLSHKLNFPVHSRQREQELYMDQAAAHLLDLNQELDVSLLDQIITIAFDGQHPKRSAANEFLVSIKGIWT